MASNSTSGASPALRVTALLLALACVAAACSKNRSADQPKSSGDAAQTTKVESADSTEDKQSTAQPANQLEAETIEWNDCDGLECGTVSVPIDPDDRALGTLDIAVNVHRATDPDRRIGYLFINPGGPGASGLELAAIAPAVLSEELVARFDIVGFDPRGVGESEPDFACGVRTEQESAVRPLTLPLDDAETAAGEAAARLCEKSMGAAAGRLGTQYVAHDIDAIREALGADQINYFGYSYGSAVGVWYAELFPDRVRAMVVDGADEIVPRTDTQEARIESGLADLRGFAEQLDLALAACADPTCPIFGDGNPVFMYLEAVGFRELVTVAAGGATSAMLLGIVTFLYDQNSWPDLYQALADLINGDPTAIVESYRFQQPEDGASFTGHVNCLDSWTLTPIDRQVRLDDGVVFEAKATELFPLIVAAAPNELDVCSFMDVVVQDSFTGTLDGADVPILVIGNRSDPATPFSKSERLATEVLSNGYLVETDHFRHTVFPLNECVNVHVHAALIDVDLPDEPRVSCAREEPKPEFAGPLLGFVCDSLIEGLGQDFTEDEAALVCDDYVARISDGRSYAEITALVGSDDEADGQKIVDLFFESVDAVIGSGG